MILKCFLLNIDIETCPLSEINFSILSFSKGNRLMRSNMIKERHTVAAKFLIKSSFERGTLAERVVKIKLVSEIKSTIAFN